MDFQIPLDSEALDELATLRQWVCWRMEERNGKFTKIPVSPLTGSPASTTSSKTWGSFDEACSEVIQLRKTKTKLHGVGFVFTEGDHYVGVDLDKCISDDGVLEDWAKKIVKDMNSYTELSPSGKGLHIFIKADIAGRGRRTGHLEVYSSARYFTYTGQHYEGTPTVINPAQEQINELFKDKFSEVKESQAKINSGPIDLDANPPLEKFEALTSNNKKFKKTWDHARPDLKDQSLSGYDLSLATQAAYAGWTDKDLIALIVAHRRKYGGLEKAARSDYMDRQINMARTAQMNDSTDIEAQKFESLEKAKDSEPDDVLAEISSQLGVPIQKIIKRGDDSAHYYFVIDGKEVLIGTSDMILSPSAVRNRIFDATCKVMSGVKMDRWIKVCGLFEKVMVVDEEYHLTRRVETIEMLQDYLEEVTLYGDDEWQEAILSDDPFEREGRIWMQTKELLRYFSATPSAGGKIGKQELVRRLVELGFQRKQFFSREKEGRGLCRNYWGIKRDTLITAFEEVL
jgi:primase-polymerase (primpol)-like protein